MYDERKRRDVGLLLGAAVPQERVAQQLGVSLRTVQRIAQQMSAEPSEESVSEAVAPPPETPPASVAAAARTGPGRPSAVEVYRDRVADLLAEEPGLKSLEVLRRLRERGYDGGKTAVYELVRQLRPRAVRPMCRFEGLAGEFSQHDFGEVRVEYTGGGRERVQFFASRLKYSRYALVTPVPNQRVETLVRTLAEHLAGFEGLPLLAVFDRPRTIVTKSDPKTGAVLEWNRPFAEALARMGLAVELCWPYRPQQKGAVENLVGWVKNSFFKVRRFLDGEDLRQQLADWHQEVNERRPSRATGRVPGEVLRAEEAPRLRPLKLGPEELDLRYPVRVGPTGMVTFQTQRYSMPAEAIGFSATLHLYRERVVIVAGRHRAEHPRLRGRDRISSLRAHRGDLLAAVTGRRARMYLKREQLLELGPAAQNILTELVHQRPTRWSDDVERLHELLQAFGSGALRAAFQRVQGRPGPSVERVTHELEGLAPLFDTRPVEDPS